MASVQGLQVLQAACVLQFDFLGTVSSHRNGPAPSHLGCQRPVGWLVCTIINTLLLVNEQHIQYMAICSQAECMRKHSAGIAHPLRLPGVSDYLIYKLYIDVKHTNT